MPKTLNEIWKEFISSKNGAIALEEFTEYQKTKVWTEYEVQELKDVIKKLKKEDF